MIRMGNIYSLSSDDESSGFLSQSLDSSGYMTITPYRSEALEVNITYPAPGSGNEYDEIKGLNVMAMDAPNWEYAYVGAGEFSF
jgi:hypothetical protein